MSEALTKKIIELENRLRRVEQTRSVAASVSGAVSSLIGNQVVFGDLEVTGDFVADKKIILKDPGGSGDYITLEVVMVQDTDYPDVYNPILKFSEGIWFGKDVYSEGFIGTNSRMSGVGGGAVFIGNRLTGIDDPPRISLTNSEDSGGTGATATATVTDGEVTTVTVTNGGSGYTSPPKVILIQAPDENGDFGTGAEVEAIVSGGQVIDFIIHEGGSGYTQAPTVHIIRGGFDTLYLTKANLPSVVTRAILDANPDYLGNLKVNTLGVHRLRDVAGKPLMHNGSKTTDANGEATVIFPSEFADVPKVFLQVTGNTHASLNVVTKSKTGFTVKAYPYEHKHRVAVAEVTADFTLSVANESSHTHSLGNHTHTLTSITLSDSPSHYHTMDVPNHRHLLSGLVYAASSTPVMTCSDESGHVHNVPVANHRHLLNNDCYATDEDFAGAHTHEGSVTINSASPVTTYNGDHDHIVGGSTTTDGDHDHAVGGSATSGGEHSHGVGGSTTGAGAHAHAVGGTTTWADGYTYHQHGVESMATDNPGDHTHGLSAATDSHPGHTHGLSAATDTKGAHSHGFVSAATDWDGGHTHTVAHLHTGSIEIFTEGVHNHHVVGATQGVDATIDGSTPIGPSTSQSGSPHSHTIGGGGHTHVVVGATRGVDSSLDLDDDGVGETPISPGTTTANGVHTHTVNGGSIGAASGSTGAGTGHTHTLNNKPPYARGLTFRDIDGVPYGVGSVLQSMTATQKDLYTEPTYLDNGEGLVVTFDWFAIATTS